MRIDSPFLCAVSRLTQSRSIKVVVTKKEGKTYAFNNKCPHLGLSLKRGEITGSDDRHGVCVVCPYHKSKFSLEDGSCKIWSESVLGIKGTEKLGEKIGSFVAPMVSVAKLMWGTDRRIPLQAKLGERDCPRTGEQLRDADA